MADAIVGLVLGKIGEAAYQEALNQYGLRGKIEWAKREFEWVSAFLKDAEAKQNKDERVKQWVKDVRDVAYMIEDVLDKSIVEVGGASKKNILKTAYKLPKELYAKHKIINEIDNIKTRMSEIRVRCDHFKIMSIEGSSGPARRPFKPIIIPEMDNTELVGFKDDVDNISNLLLNPSDLRRSVISIVGAGGRGKSTLATKVYNSAEVERHFESRIWLIISKEYQMIDVLKKMLKKLGRTDGGIQQMDEEDCITELHNSLKKKRYLVMLDDVWSTDLWAQLEVTLPQDNNGSRVLITTRYLNVAGRADANVRNTYQLRILNEEESIKLLLQKAFPNQPSNEYPDNLLERANLLAKKCGGLPLALVVLGGILSTKYPDFHTWDEIISKLNWNTDGNECMGIVSTSYDDLPLHLKPCFMYFAAFPEDYEISVQRLVRLWIAEGFIKQEATKTVEDTAMNYLEELVQRCLIQASRLSRLGKMRGCRIHDILHELAINKTKENDFLTVYSKSTSNSISTSTSARRAAFHEVDNAGPVGAIGPNHRSLIYNGNMDLPNCNKLRMARVVDLHDYSWTRNEFDLKWLQYLGTTLRYLKIESGHTEVTCNVSFLADLKHLQTLDIYHLKPHLEEINIFSTLRKNRHFWVSSRRKMRNILADQAYASEIANKIFQLPTSFWDSRMLRHVKWNSSFDPIGPPSSANLGNLLTLGFVAAREEWATKLPHFPVIRKLKMNLVKVAHCWEPMSNLLSKLENLISLKLVYSGSRIKYPIITPAFRDYKQMRSLDIHGYWPKNAVIDGSRLPSNLVKLKLSLCLIRKDPMPELEKLLKLRVLELCHSAYVGEKLECSREGFRCLQHLTLYQLHNLEELKIEKGAMPMLNVFVAETCFKMEKVPDFQYLTNLRELDIGRMPHVFNSSIQGEDQHKVGHIPSITITASSTWRS